MMNKILDFLGRIALLVFLLGTIILTCYGVIALGAIIFKWLARII